MYKKSIAVVCIQLLGVFLNLVSVYVIAGDMEPEIYSLVGVYGVISTIVLNFSDLGIETVMGREALYWIAKDEDEKYTEYATQGIISRVSGFVILLPFLIIYILYLNQTKYDGQQLFLLGMMITGSLFNAVSDSVALMVRARGEYVFCQAVRTANNYLVKTIGIMFYFLFGTEIYLIFYTWSSLPLLLVLGLKMRKYFDKKYLDLRNMAKKIWKAKYFWLNTDLGYVRSNIDSFLVSAVFPPSVMGSYTILKNLQNMCKGLIEGFFDVLSQSMVQYKGDEDMLEKREKQIKFARNICLAAVLCAVAVFSVNPEYFVKLVNLEHYDGIISMSYCVLVTSILLLTGKFEINAVSFFASSKLVFAVSCINTVLALCSYITVYMRPDLIGMMMQQSLIYLINSAAAIIVFHKNRKKFYTEINA